MRKKYLSALVASVALVALGLSSVSSASATEVTPAGAAFTAKLHAGTEATFTPANGTFAVSISCTVSTATGSVPTAGPPALNNLNHSTSTNTTTYAGGSVLTTLSSPSFTTCSSAAGVTTTVTTNSTNGKWSLDWNTLDSQAGQWRTAAIGVPKAGAVIKLVKEAKTCELTVDSEIAQGVIGYWENGGTGVPSEFSVNEQVFFAPVVVKPCEEILGATATSPAVFRAKYDVSEGSGNGIIEKYS